MNLILNAIDAMSGTAVPRDLLVTSAKGESNEVMVTYFFGSQAKPRS